MSEIEPTKPAKPQPRIGSYQLLNSLGSGGMSSVFKAVHVETGHVVALKVLPRALAKNITLLQRFLREAKSAEALEHPNIVSIYDRGVDQGRYYLVLEYVEGGDLHDRVRNGGPLGIVEATAVIRAVCRGLQFAASRGLIHRDIKPANILQSSAGVVKIIDLGLALQAESEDERVTREGTTVGTVDYMAPEQARDSRATSERSDMYSLGCTFFFLLTGSPPFPGGDVADKLSRHCLQPPPDPRTLRPEIPAPLALLIQRMMAKRPENRFADYEELVDELDAAPTGAEAPPEVPLFALIDDGDDAEDDEAPVAPRPEEPLFALIDEEEAGEADQPPEADVLGLLSSEAPVAESVKNRDVTHSLREISLAELAPLTDETPAASPLRRTFSTGRRENPDLPAPLAEALLEDEQDEDSPGTLPSFGARASHDSTKKLVITYALLGLGLVMLVIGSHQLIRYTSARPQPDFVVEPSNEEPALPPVAPVPEPEPPAPKPARPAPQVAVARPVPIAAKPAPTPSGPSVWVEPADVVEADSREESTLPAAVANLLPEWARAEIPARLGNRFVSVRRIVDPHDSSQCPSLRLALDVIGGTVEVADNGPFFEDDLRVAGDSRLVRARPGYRPIVAVEPPQIAVVGEQQGVVVLDGKSLILDGIDLIVDVASLPHNQGALFLCRGGSLTLRNCTVTIVNYRDLPFDFVRTEPSSRPSRLRLEQTLVRGSSYTAFQLRGGSSEVVVSRSLIAGGRKPLVTARTNEPGFDSRILILQSLMCGRGPIFELGSTAAVKNPALLAVRAFGSTFSNLAGEATTSFILSTPDETQIADQLRWSGDENYFAGWHEWCSSGPGRTIKIANLARARSVWPTADGSSREDPARWNLAADPERMVPLDLVANVKESSATVPRAAVPSPYLFQKTIESFARLKIPPLAPVPPPQTPPVAANELPKPTVAPAAVPTPPAGRQVARDLVFDLQANPWQGDLGLFLHDNLKADDLRLRVFVNGGGAHFCTPIRLPEGVSLEIYPLPENPAGRPPILWSPRRATEAEAMIEVRGGDLVLSNVRLHHESSGQPKRLVRVERGHLVLTQCWLTAPGPAEKVGGSLIGFHSPGTQPLAPGPSPFQTPPDRPICWVVDSLFITGGDVLLAELGRGGIRFTNCAIAAGNDAFTLVPGKVARNRFEATLCLERCTIAAERSFVHLKEWRGSPTGPDRPWLVSTKDSAFVSSFDRLASSRESVLLRVEGDSLAQGTLFWQSVNGAYDVGHFATRGSSPPVANRRADVHRQWVEFWGESHMHSDTGPIWSKGSAVPAPSVRFHDRLASGRVAPADLALDPNYYPGRSRLTVGANLARMHVKTTRQARRQ